MSTRPPIVLIVDDDASTRHLFAKILAEAGIASQKVDSAAAFLETFDPAQPGCLLLDVQMPGMDGPELQNRLNLAGAMLPVIFISAHADVSTAVRAMSHGAFDFLEKSLDFETLRKRVRAALQFDAENRAALAQRAAIVERLKSLTAREREILGQLLAGSSNKEMAVTLGLSQRTVELHRARIMEKTQSRSLAQLIRMAIETNFTGA